MGSLPVPDSIMVIYVCDQFSHHIQLLDTELNFIWQPYEITSGNGPCPNIVYETVKLYCVSNIAHNSTVFENCHTKKQWTVDTVVTLHLNILREIFH